jgi:hypothetical protein
LTKAVRAIAAVGISAVIASCAGIGGGTFNGKPADIYSIIPSQRDVQSLMGDANWWSGVPTFAVPPLNGDSVPPAQRFAVSMDYLHIGTEEELLANYAVFDKASSATTVMSDYQTALGTSPSSPKIGDQVLYYGMAGSGAAPYAARTFVRVGQIVVQLIWYRKNPGITVDQLAKLGRRFSQDLKNINNVHGKLKAADPNELPPAGLSITPLGSASMPIEAYPVMSRTAMPEQILALMHNAGVSDFAYGDFALNNDPHMEVQSALLTFPTATDAGDWASAFAPGQPDSNGISFGYIPTGGTPAAGVYHFVFASGRYGAFLVCKSAVDGEAASRECEDPVGTVALAWKLALGGLR